MPIKNQNTSLRARQSQPKIINCLYLLLVWVCIPATAQMNNGTYQGFKIIKNQDGPDVISINVLSLGNDVCQFGESESKKMLDGHYHIIIHRNKYVTGNFTKGIANGDWEEFIGNKLNVKSSYKNGKYDGRVYRYGVMGLDNKYPAVSTFKDGIIQHKISYHQNGQVYAEIFYDENGWRNGNEITYDKDGNITGDENYLHGKHHGKQMEISTDGYKLTSGYNNGVLTGEYCRLYPNGNVEAKGAYDENGKKAGKWIWGRIDGSISTEANYLNDQLHGEEQIYYESGILQRCAEYTNGKRNGKSIYYRENPHVISEEGMFVDGKHHGEYKIYSYGKLSEIRVYREDVVVSEKEYVDGKLRTIRLLDENGSLVNVEQYNNAGKRTYQNTGYKKHVSIKLKESASGVIDVEIE